MVVSSADHASESNQNPNDCECINCLREAAARKNPACRALEKGTATYNIIWSRVVLYRRDRPNGLDCAV